MTHALREWIVQFSGRIHFTQQNICQSFTALFAGIPLSKNGRDMFFHPRHGKGFACQQDDYYRLPRSIYRLYQLFLYACQFQIAQVKSFSAGRIAVITGQWGTGWTHDHDTYITPACNFHGFCKAVTIICHQVATLCIMQLGFPFQTLCQCFAQSHPIFVVTTPGVVAKLYLICIRANESYAMRLIHLQG